MGVRIATKEVGIHSTTVVGALLTVVGVPTNHTISDKMKKVFVIIFLPVVGVPLTVVGVPLTVVGVPTNHHMQQK